MKDRAMHICARLIREGTILREDLPELDLPDVRHDVEKKLFDVGLVLATSAYSNHVGLRLSEEVTSSTAFDAASNVGLRSDACALLVLLWARLVLQKRTATDSHSVPGQANLYSQESAREARNFTPQVREETLFREFGSVIGSRTNLRRMLTTLRRLGFVGGRGDAIEAGPLLELGIDGERMISFIRRGVLSQLMEERDAPEEEAPTASLPEDRVCSALKEAGGPAAMKQLKQATGMRKAIIRRILKSLVEAGKVKRTGERAATRYHLVEGP